MNKIVATGVVVLIVVIFTLGYYFGGKGKEIENLRATGNQERERNEVNAKVGKHSDDQLRRDINGLLGHR